MRSKLMKIVTIGIFAVAMLLNISVYFDANDSSNADLSLGSLKVSLFQKAYAETSDGGVCVYNPKYDCPLENGDEIEKHKVG